MKKVLLCFLLLVSATTLLASPAKGLLGGKGTHVTDGDSENVVRVEYIESSGTQYINTGYQLKSTDSIDCTFQTLYYGRTGLLGARINLGDNQYEFHFVNQTLYGFYNNQRSGANISSNISSNEIYRLEASQGNYLLNGSIVRTYTVGDFINDRPCYLFSVNGYNVSAARIRLFGFNINGGETMEMKPVRFLNEENEWEGGLLDIVSGEIFRNQGRGSFLIGPDKN